MTADDAMTAAGGPVRALLAISRLLAATATAPAAEVHTAVVREARACFAPRAVLLLGQEPGRRLRVLAGDGPPRAGERALDVDAHPAFAEALDRRVRRLRLEGGRAAALAPLLDPGLTEPRSALLLLLRASDDVDALLLLADPPAPVASDGDVATAFADAAAAALDRLRAHVEHERQTAQQEALTRAAKSLNGSLDLDTVLTRICHESATILGCQVATVYRETPSDGLVIAAVHGMAPEAVGYRLPAGAGLAGKVLVQRRAMLTNDYERVAERPPDSPLPPAASAMGAPMVWDGELRGVLTVGWTEPRGVTGPDLALLETFAELAATACANASAHAGLAHIARTDGLTGCLNHAALHDSLRREIERVTRAGATAPPLSLVLVDLDHFKQVNEVHGHLAGDEVLRRAGHALRSATRPYDLAARYGGDEFALITVESGEGAALDIARRALARMDDAIGEFLPPGGTAGTAGVAEWSPGVSVAELIARADRALLFAKQEGARGQVLAFSEVAEHFRPGRFARPDRHLPEPPPMPEPDRDWPGQRLDERLRRRTRQLALANALGARLAAMTDPAAILDAAVEELNRAFGFFCAAIIQRRDDGLVEAVTLRGAPFVRLLEQHWVQPAADGLIGRCLRTRRPVLANDVHAEPEYVLTPETSAVQSELVVPLWVGEDLWGVINVEEVEPNAFHEDDVMLLETVAAQAGSALRSALLYEQLERAYLGTAEALASALEAKDEYTAEHARSIVLQAEAVGRELGLGEEVLRDLRLAAVFHDVGKVAVPEVILQKPGPLDDEERAVVERHAEAGDEILAPVPFLRGVRRLVRHEHERFDGGGYPDGLAGDEIPLGSRIILACDALHAMTSDRPYRRALSFEAAVAELRRHAGSQFDPQVVEALLAVLGREGLPVAAG